MKNELYKFNGTIVRILNESDQSVFIIDCLNPKMPYTMPKTDFKDAILCDEDLLIQETKEPVFDIVANVQCPKKLNTKYTTSVKNRSKRKCHIDFMEDILNG